MMNNENVVTSFMKTIFDNLIILREDAKLSKSAEAKLCRILQAAKVSEDIQTIYAMPESVFRLRVCPKVMKTNIG